MKTHFRTDWNMFTDASNANSQQQVVANLDKTPPPAKMPLIPFSEFCPYARGIKTATK